MYHPGLCSPLINSIVSNDSCSGQRRPWSVCADAQSDLGHRCLHMPEGTVSHGATHMTILYKDADSAGGQNFDCNWRVLLLWPYIESFNQSLIHFEKRVFQHFPIQIYGGEIWPCCKKVEGQRRIIIWTNWVEFPSLMLYTNIQLQSFSPASVAQLDGCTSDCWSGGQCRFDPRRVGNILSCFSWIDHEIFSTAILSLPLFKKGSCQFLSKESAQYWLTD